MVGFRELGFGRTLPKPLPTGLIALTTMASPQSRLQFIDFNCIRPQSGVSNVYRRIEGVYSPGFILNPEESWLFFVAKVSVESSLKGNVTVR